MNDSYSVKYSNGNVSFEVHGSDHDWVSTKFAELKALAETAPVATQSNTGAGGPTDKPEPKKSVNRAMPTGKSVSNFEAIWNDGTADSISAFIEARRTAFDAGTANQAAIIAVFLKDEYSLDTLTAKDLELIYRKLGLPTINHVAQLTNAKNRNNYFESNDGVYSLTHAGTRFGRDTSKG